MSIILMVEPMGKPRMTQRDKWKGRGVVLRYHAFCDSLRAEAGRKAYTPAPQGERVTFWIGMPSSWTKEKRARMYGEPHQQRPDLDNLHKAFLDALLPEDCMVWDTSIRKLWGTYGRIEVEEWWTP
jgi:Holliday junction resolvase RusA-like endonuclease